MTRGGIYILRTVSTCDTAATIAYVLGLAPPDSRIAKPVIEAFSTHPHSKR